MHAGTWKMIASSGGTHDLTARTLGILGIDGIGLRLARLSHARTVPQSAPSDRRTTHAPLRKETRGLVGECQIRAMMRGSVTVDTARGGVLDEVIRALEDGHVGRSSSLFFSRGR